MEKNGLPVPPPNTAIFVSYTHLTGSIGTQSLDVIRAQGYEVFGLSAHSHVDKILQQIEEFHPRYVCMTDPDAEMCIRDSPEAGRPSGGRSAHPHRTHGHYRHAEL